MKMNIPKGGFFLQIDSTENNNKVNSLLKKEEFKTTIISELNLLVGVFEQFDGQGLWCCDNGGVVFDVDITNQNKLNKLLDNYQNFVGNQGQLIWTLYKKMGIAFLNLLRGAFGFSLWDLSEKKIITVTDPIGIRPVVFNHYKKRFVAASRIRHIFLNSEIIKVINPDAIYHYLFFEAIPSPVTIYKEINKLEPGKAIVYDLKTLKEHKYYDIEYSNDHSKKISFWIKNIPQEIHRAVKNYSTICDSKTTGCFLSGGTDSSSITYYYGQVSSERVKTFSIGFDDKDFNELDFAHIASKAYQTIQKDYYVTPEDVLHLVEKMPIIYDEPFGNSSVVPAYYCSKIAAESGVNTLLGGDGGDEIFGGNERYAKNLNFELYQKIPPLLKYRLMEPFVKFFSNNPIIYRAGRYIRRSNIPNPERFYSYSLLYENAAETIFKKDFLAHIDRLCFINLAKYHYFKTSANHVTDKLMYLDMKFTITDNDLRKVTQMAEAAGIRARYPMLDIDLINFAATIPADLKVRIGKERYIFKRAMNGILPSEIIRKKKHGMGLPIANWFKTDNDLLNLLNDNLFAKNARIKNYVRTDFMDMMKNAFWDDNTPYYGSNFWVFLILELWLRANDGLP